MSSKFVDLYTIMNSRQQIVLNNIIENYIARAQPVGSLALAEELGVSSATIRNEMSTLEHEGYLVQPHTSSGRVPTEKAYVFYLRELKRKDAPVRCDDEGALRQALASQQQEHVRLKMLAKALVALSGETVIIAHAEGWSYYAGLSNLFSKPDFAELAALQSLFEILDHTDEIVDRMFGRVREEPAVMVGHDNPFGERMSIVITACPSGEQEREGLLGLLGPMRMDYRKNIALVQTARDMLVQYL